MPMGFRPTLVVVAGPNGSGKTSFLTCMSDKQRIIGEWINPDEIAQKEFAGWNDPQSIIQAANLAEERREKAIAERRDFTFETVLSAQDKLAFIQKAKNAGFFVRAYFIATESPDINAARVARRMMSGGHMVPIDKIISRYYRSVANLPALVRLADITQVFDNSLNDREHRHMFSFVDGALHKQRVADQEMPGWGWKIINTLQAEHLLHRSNEKPPLTLDHQINAAMHEQDLPRRLMLLDRAAEGIALLQADVSRAANLAHQAADLFTKMERADKVAVQLGQKFAESFNGVYREPAPAIAAWNNAVEAENDQIGVLNTMRSHPEMFGKLRGNSMLGFAGAERREAIEAVPTLVEAGMAYIKASQDAKREKPRIEATRRTLTNDPVHYQATVAQGILASCDIAGLKTALGQARIELQRQEVAAWVQTATINLDTNRLTPTWRDIDEAEQRRRQTAFTEPEGQQALFEELARREPARALQWQQENDAEDEVPNHRGPTPGM